MSKKNDNTPDWAYERAAELMNEVAKTRSFAVENVKDLLSVKAFAKYIAEHEEPPVDRDVLVVREIFSNQKIKEGRVGYAYSYRNGLYDQSSYFQLALEAYRKGKTEASQ